MLDSDPHLSRLQPTHIKTCLNHPWCKFLHSYVHIFKTNLKIHHLVPLLKLNYIFNVLKVSASRCSAFKLPFQQYEFLGKKRSVTEPPTEQLTDRHPYLWQRPIQPPLQGKVCTPMTLTPNYSFTEYRVGKEQFLSKTSCLHHLVWHFQLSQSET